MSLLARFGYALRASLFGWIAGLVAALPFQVVEAVRNAGVETRLLTSALCLALALWLLLSLIVSVYFCCLFLFPVVWIVSPATIVRHRILWIAINTAFGVVLIALRGHIWTNLEHDGVSLINFWMWSVYSAIFFMVASAFFVKFVRAAPVTA